MVEAREPQSHVCSTIDTRRVVAQLPMAAAAATITIPVAEAVATVERVASVDCSGRVVKQFPMAASADVQQVAMSLIFSSLPAAVAAAGTPTTTSELPVAT